MAHLLFSKIRKYERVRSSVLIITLACGGGEYAKIFFIGSVSASLIFSINMDASLGILYLISMEISLFNKSGCLSFSVDKHVGEINWVYFSAFCSLMTELTCFANSSADGSDGAGLSAKQ